jgi:Lysyl oxidase
MRFARLRPQCSGVAVGALAAAVIVTPGVSLVSAGGAAAAVTKAADGPVITLVATQPSVTVDSFQGNVLMDPGIWVASLGSALRFNVRRAYYTRPVTINQVIHTPGGRVEYRPLPARLLDGWNGLRDFIKMTVRDHTGQVVASSMLTFCPNTFDPERASPQSPAATRYPQQCGADPFPKSMVWGIAKGWATDPAENYPPSSLGPGPFLHLKPGRYRVTETITATYARLLHIPASGTSRTAEVTVVKGSSCCTMAANGEADRSGASAALSPLPHARYLASPPKRALPDLVALPSWGISTSHTTAGRNLLNFGATVWSGGSSPLDVEGFRSPGSPVMKAYQYFWQDGHLLGRTRAGIMRFDSRHGHNHWHFEQFARYQLLTATKKLAVSSHKQGFCIGPSDPVDLLAPHAVWQPAVTGLAGPCGQPTALWVREMLPVGWGDTYFQSVAGQSFDITKVPNGTYYIEVAANPRGILHEITSRNDVSLRKVILSGTSGQRQVRVPAWHGIDPEP